MTDLAAVEAAGRRARQERGDTAENALLGHLGELFDQAISDALRLEPGERDERLRLLGPHRFADWVQVIEGVPPTPAGFTYSGAASFGTCDQCGRLMELSPQVVESHLRTQHG